MGDDLQARLQSHARAFEGLMSLIPAKEYYGKDESITSNQWRQKKQTSEERRAARKAKLDPANYKSAKDVLDENARKRKRKLEEGDESSDVDMDIEKEKPLEGMKAVKAKKQKTEAAATDTTTADDTSLAAVKAKAKVEKRKLKQEQKKEKMIRMREKKQQQKAQGQEFAASLVPAHGQEEDVEAMDGDDAEEAPSIAEQGIDHVQAMDVSGLVDDSHSTATPSSGDSNNSTASVASAASSTSSIIPTVTEDGRENKKKKPLELDPKQHEVFRARLEARLEAMRAARKADGPNGRPAKNRAELIEERRKKEAERKAAKKANRQLAKEDEARLKAEAELEKLRGGSGSPSLFPMRLTPEQEHNLAFGRVAWNDGQQMESSLSGFMGSRKRKGTSDPKTALEAAQRKKARINSLDEEKRKDIQEKDAWLAAKKRAQGEKVHDDENLLKRSVKRKEKAKAKSSKEWTDRITGVQKGKEAKQKKREANLKKRREEKGGKKGKGQGKRVLKPGKKVRRPGFEGTFKAR